MNEAHIQQVVNGLQSLGLNIVHFSSRGLLWIEVCRIAKNDNITFPEFEEGERRWIGVRNGVTERSNEGS